MKKIWAGVTIFAVACFMASGMPEAWASDTSSKAFADFAFAIDAFEHGDFEKLAVYDASEHPLVSLFAKGAVARLRGNSAQARRSFAACVETQTEPPGDDVLRYACMLAVGGADRELGRYRESHLDDASACAIIRAMGAIPGGAAGSAWGGYAESQAKKCNDFEQTLSKAFLPETSFTVDPTWKSISLVDGRVSVLVNGTPVDFVVDTGATDMVINCNDNAKVCSGLRDSGFSVGVADYSRTHVLKGKIASSLDFGPIHVKNAYMIELNAGPSAIGLQYLRRLKGFVMDDSGIYRKNLPSRTNCSNILFGYNSISSDVSFMYVDINTNLGEYRVILDTGSVSSGKMHNASLFLYGDAADKVGRGAIKSVFDTGHVVMRQYGRSVVNRVDYFHYSIIGTAGSLTGMLWPRGDFYKNMADGVLGAKLIKQIPIYIDFEGMNVCFPGPDWRRSSVEIVTRRAQDRLRARLAKGDGPRQSLRTGSSSLL